MERDPWTFATGRREIKARRGSTHAALDSRRRRHLRTSTVAPPTRPSQQQYLQTARYIVINSSREYLWFYDFNILDVPPRYICVSTFIIYLHMSFKLVYNCKVHFQSFAYKILTKHTHTPHTDATIEITACDADGCNNNFSQLYITKSRT